MARGKKITINCGLDLDQWDCKFLNITIDNNTKRATILDISDNPFSIDIKNMKITNDKGVKVKIDNPSNKKVFCELLLNQEIVPNKLVAKSSVNAVTLSSKVTEIAAGAFAGCRKLESLSLPYSCKLKTIGEEAFAGCSLRELDLQFCSKLSEISDNAFKDSHLTRVVFPYEFFDEKNAAQIKEMLGKMFGDENAWQKVSANYEDGSSVFSSEITALNKHINEHINEGEKGTECLFEVDKFWVEANKLSLGINKACLANKKDKAMAVRSQRCTIEAKANAEIAVIRAKTGVKLSTLYYKVSRELAKRKISRENRATVLNKLKGAMDVISKKGELKISKINLKAKKAEAKATRDSISNDLMSKLFEAEIAVIRAKTDVKTSVMRAKFNHRSARAEAHITRATDKKAKATIFWTGVQGKIRGSFARIRDSFARIRDSFTFKAKDNLSDSPILPNASQNSRINYVTPTTFNKFDCAPYKTPNQLLSKPKANIKVVDSKSMNNI